MTGFGRAEGAADGVELAWELRAVNGKGLDVRLRMPGAMDRLEPAVRAAAKRHLARGNLQAALRLERAGTSQLNVDEDAAAELVAAARRLHDKHDLAMPDAGAVLLMRGVLDAGGGECPEGLHDLALATLERALDALVSEREREGATLAVALGEQVDAIERLTEAAAADPSREPATIRSRLGEQVARLFETELDPDRVHAEAVLLAVRADLAEELDRLRAHVASARALLGEGGAVGRRLDFLAQEFMREANTLCAKSNAASLTAIGLDLKLTVDRFREQVQNIE